MLHVLLVDDEPSIRLTVADALEASGFTVRTAEDGVAAMGILENQCFDVVVTDIRMPKLDGLSLFRRLKQRYPDTDAILITAYGDVSDAVAALKDGAFDYLTKPFDNDELLLRLGRLAERRQLRKELTEARNAIAGHDPGTGIVGRSPPMVRLLKRLTTLAKSDASVVVTGESGTGKELVARALHAGSPRVDKPFVTINCAAFPETLIEAELFGHEKGAFTGAMRQREGRFKAADGGTLFLDEVGEIPLMIQAKLLRVLQDGIIEPLGSNQAVKVNVRIISATHRNLKQLIAEGNFREDLFYRLNVLDIHVPPLRQRRGDLALLVEFFLRKHGNPNHENMVISPRAWAALSEYSFPGNVRELEHAIHHAVALAAEGQEIDLEHLPSDIAGGAHEETGEVQSQFRELQTAAREFEREYLLRALNAAAGKKTKAADMLGISRKNLWEKLKGHGITESDLED